MVAEAVAEVVAEVVEEEVVSVRTTAGQDQDMFPAVCVNQSHPRFA